MDVMATVLVYALPVVMETARVHVLIAVVVVAKMYVGKAVPIHVVLRVAPVVVKGAKDIAMIFVLGAEMCALKTVLLDAVPDVLVPAPEVVEAVAVVIVEEIVRARALVDVDSAAREVAREVLFMLIIGLFDEREN